MLSQLIYVSRPLGFDGPTLAGILSVARQRNAEHDVTGALICRDDIFLQLLEGPPDAVTQTYARIARDTRHIDLHMLSSGPIQMRRFPSWDMLHDPARSWLWTPEQVWADAPRKASVREVEAIFERVAAEPIDA